MKRALFSREFADRALRVEAIKAACANNPEGVSLRYLLTEAEAILAFLDGGTEQAEQAE